MVMRKHLEEKLLPSGDTLVRVLTHRQQMDKLLTELLDSEEDDDDGDETETTETP